jgi:UDP-N-acetyl-D-mannosaminuronic acid dehydrogenase
MVSAIYRPLNRKNPEHATNTIMHLRKTNMKITLTPDRQFEWSVRKIGVIGPGIVGMPMAALLANARIRIGCDVPAEVVVIQRNSVNSGWKVDAINSGKSVIGGIEPGLNKIVEDAVRNKLLSASHDFGALSDSDVILICVQTDKKSFEPDYGPMFGALESLAEALQKKPPKKVPLLIFESTLAPSTMTSLIRDHFARYGLIEGRDILLGNSPNRVMPGRLVERVTQSDKLVAGLHPETPRMIKAIYSHIVTEGTLHQTNSMAAEITKTLENAYRDVRIAFSSEIVRYCDQNDIDFYKVRDKVNLRLQQSDEASADPNAVPSGGILVPMLGVGGHCLPKDGILLWWRKIQSKCDTSKSLILKSREINDESPGVTIDLAERSFGKLDGKKVAIFGTAYRFNSEDTRNSPSIALALHLLDKGCTVALHDPYVKVDDQNLLKYGVEKLFTNDADQAMADAEYAFFGTAHVDYMEQVESLLNNRPRLKGIIDACNLYQEKKIERLGYAYTGIGRGRKEPSTDFVNFVYESFRTMERGLANELGEVIDFLNEHYATEGFNKVSFKEVQFLAGSCNTGCAIVDCAPVGQLVKYNGFHSRLVECAVAV